MSMMSSLHPISGWGMMAGGRARARRLLVVLTIVTTTALSALVAADDRSGDAPIVAVREQDGLYTITARFSIAEPADLAIAVLTDYEQIPRFMPDVRKSKVLSRNGGHVIVEQEATARLLLFSKDFHLVLAVDEQPLSVHFTDQCGRNFTRYEGVWRVADENGRVAVSYELTAQPTFGVPSFVANRLFKRNATTMIDRVRREISARATSAMRATGA